MSFDTWRRYPFSAGRWIVYALELTLAAAGVWLLHGSWWSWAIVAAVLSLDYLWTCWQVAKGPTARPPG
ncbi:MAG: hypothetical protein U0P45_14260 [Acidimicrobiales bacterium]